MDGLEVLRQIKGDPALKMIPVVMMTSSRQEQDLVPSYELGVNAYVVKPLKFQDFVDAVKQVGAFWAVLNEVPESAPPESAAMQPVRLHASSAHLEDSPRDAELVRHRLDERRRVLRHPPGDGKDSFEAALTREPFDLIISDYNLPGYDGITALKQAQATQPDVPVILISGTVGEEQAVKCLQIGATDYLLKERLDRLVPAVLRALQEAETRRTRKRAEAALERAPGRDQSTRDRWTGDWTRRHD